MEKGVRRTKRIREVREQSSEVRMKNRITSNTEHQTPNNEQQTFRAIREISGPNNKHYSPEIHSYCLKMKYLYCNKYHFRYEYIKNISQK